MVPQRTVFPTPQNQTREGLKSAYYTETQGENSHLVNYNTRPVRDFFVISEQIVFRFGGGG